MDTQAIEAVTGTASSTQPVEAAAAQSIGSVNKAVTRAARKSDDEAERSITVPTRDARSLKYWVDGESRQVVTAVIDDRDMTVIRQIPDEEIVRIARAIDRMQGFLVDSKA